MKPTMRRSSIILFLAVSTSALFSGATAFASGGGQNTGVNTDPISCDVRHTDCLFIEFDRPHNTMWAMPNRKDIPHDNKVDYANAIRNPASKTLYSGTIISALHHLAKGECAREDWRVVLLSKESSNVLIYGPADISEFCDDDHGRISVVVPVHVLWVQLFHYEGNLRDPFRKPAWPISAVGDYCPDASKDFPTADPIKDWDIRPCDLYSSIGVLYDRPNAFLYNHLTQPGTFQGTLSFTPAIGKVPNATGAPPGEKAPAETLSFDVQLYASGKLGKGWIGFPLVFEKANAATANLNSLIMGISYDVPLGSTGSEYAPPSTDGLRFSIRPPDLRIQYGPEFAVSTPHDINMVASGVARLPLIFDVHHQPSAISIFPVVGIEGGNHFSTHLTENDSILRRVVGFDSSLRVPFILTHAFLGDKPNTIDFAWRTRYLSYAEPFTDYVSGIAETLSKQQRSYWRGSFIVPVSTLIQFKLTVQHGGLPPDFDYLGYSVNLGLTFGNPGYSEH